MGLIPGQGTKISHAIRPKNNKRTVVALSDTEVVDISGMPPLEITLKTQISYC